MKRFTFRSAFFSPCVLIALLLCAAGAGLASSGTLLALSRDEVPGRAQRTLTLQERVSYQRAIEEVYWRHRIWPKERPDPKPSLDAVMSQAQLEKKVKSYLRNSGALEDDWQRPITAEQLQTEMDRMAQNTRQPEVLRELFEALGNDPFVIAECLGRPILAERLLAHPAIERVKQQSRTFDQTVAGGPNYTLPAISDPSVGCIGDTWTPTNLTGAPDARVSHTAVWTGSEMIVWGGYGCDGNCLLNTGGRYNPSTDNWTATSTNNAPQGRVYHTAVWSGSEMIVWGGEDVSGFPASGGKYNPDYEHLDGDQHDWCTQWPIFPHGSVDRQRNDCLGWAGTSIALNTGGQIQSKHGHLDCHKHRQRALRSICSHRCLDWKPNDRLGWPRPEWGFKHGRKIQSQHELLDSHQHCQCA